MLIWPVDQANRRATLALHPNGNQGFGAPRSHVLNVLLIAQLTIRSSW